MPAHRATRPSSTAERRCATAAVRLGVAAAVGSVVVPLAAAPAQAASYTVRPGDTLSALAVRTGSTVAALAGANALRDPSRLFVGQQLQLPGTAAAAPAAQSAPAAASVRTWTVTAGDTLGAVAARTGTTVAALASANGLRDPGRIFVGQRLVVPGTTTGTSTGTTTGVLSPVPVVSPGAQPSGGASTVVVRAGDTVSAIAARAHLPVGAVLAANGLRSTSIIRPGQVLTLPAGASSGATGAPATPSVVPVSNSFAGRTYASGVTNAATLNRQTLAARSVPSTAQMQQIVRDTAVRMGVDPALALAVAFQESGFNMRSVSPANAVGVMQVIPSSGRWASDLVGRPLDLLDPQDNATAGVAILRSLTTSAPDLPTAIAGYYQGLAGVLRNGMYADTKRYVANVQALMTRFG